MNVCLVVLDSPKGAYIKYIREAPEIGKYSSIQDSNTLNRQLASVWQSNAIILGAANDTCTPGVWTMRN
uniref:Uncharacterized protein n=1 Tax=Arundo donax TaxID=35708 RepID=A0A0A8ZS72_ARUDO